MGSFPSLQKGGFQALKVAREEGDESSIKSDICSRDEGASEMANGA